MTFTELKERARYIRSRFGHEDARLGLTLHQERQSPAVIEMGVGKNDRVQLPIAQDAEVWQRLVAFFFRMHPAIQHETLTGGFEVITVCADLSPAREINEFQFDSYSCSCSDAP